MCWRFAPWCGGRRCGINKWRLTGGPWNMGRGCGDPGLSGFCSEMWLFFQHMLCHLPGEPELLGFELLHRELYKPLFCTHNLFSLACRGSLLWEWTDSVAELTAVGLSFPSWATARGICTTLTSVYLFSHRVSLGSLKCTILLPQPPACIITHSSCTVLEKMTPRYFYGFWSFFFQI
jgi:hypothetical protein